MTGLARLVRTNALASMENMALWHERDISRSSVERVIMPDSTILMDYILHRLTGLLANLRVIPQNMERNLALSCGLYFSQRVLLALWNRAWPVRKHMFWCSAAPCTAGIRATTSPMLSVPMQT